MTDMTNTSDSQTTSALHLRRVTPADAEACGRIAFEAFAGIAERHNFPPDFPAPEPAIGVLTMLTSHPGFHGILAERDGHIVGSNFLDERSGVAGIGPITIDPAAQDAGVGRVLMEAILARARERGFAAVRLVQAAYHCRSFSLYTKLGFDVREPLTVLTGDPVPATMEGRTVRTGTAADLDTCHALCLRVHGHDRAGEVQDALSRDALRVAERDGRIVGYSTGLGFFGHSIGETWQDVAAFIATPSPVVGPGLIVPMRESELLRWALASGRRVIQPLTLMTIGPYQEPKGGWLPSILY